MRVLLLAVVAAPIALLAAAPAQADSGAPPPPPYVDHTHWAQWGKGLTTLRVYPTPAGRAASRDQISPDEAWSEVLADTPGADTPGMRDQFVCHWQFAEIAEPGKVSWNLEPWRPVVDYDQMILTGCNPGGAEEPS